MKNFVIRELESILPHITNWNNHYDYYTYALKIDSRVKTWFNSFEELPYDLASSIRYCRNAKKVALQMCWENIRGQTIRCTLSAACEYLPFDDTYEKAISLEDFQDILTELQGSPKSYNLFSLKAMIDEARRDRTPSTYVIEFTESA